MRWLLLCLLSVFLVGFVSAAPHSVDSRFSQAEGRLSLSGSSLSVVDDAVYKIGYYAHDGDSDWTPFVLDGSVLGGDWLRSGTYTLPDFGVGEHYVVVYSCTASGSAWSCHDGRWQLHVISNGDGGLVASYDFESSAGGTLAGGASLVQDAEKGSVLLSDGGSFHVPASPSLDIHNSLSLSAWIKLNSLDINGKIVIKPTDGGADPWEVYSLIVSGGSVRFILSDGSPSGESGMVSVPLSVDVWHHVVGTYDGATMRLYVDGSLENSDTISLVIGDSDEDLIIGSYLSCCSLDGLIDDVAVFDYALLEEEVLELYGGGIINPVECTSGDTHTGPCPVTNGAGTQTRNCVNEEWSSWSSCSVVSCDAGYEIVGNGCVVINIGNPEIADYYVAVNGNNNNPGTIDEPFASWQRGFDAAQPGDLVYIRGGTYHPPLTTRAYGVLLNGKSGTASNRIQIFAYPGEQPVLDASGLTGASTNVGILLSNTDYWHLKGLEVQGVQQHDSRIPPAAIRFNSGNNNIFEKLSLHDNQGIGLNIYGPSENNLVLNCDFYNNFDSEGESYIGGHADGMSISYVTERDGDERVNTIRGCRSWGNSDDGYDFWENDGVVIIEDSWAFDNGLANGDGNGFKLARTFGTQELVSQRVLTRCLAVGNRAVGFNTNDAQAQALRISLYNNFAYQNSASGFYLYNTLDTDAHELHRELRNNIAFDNGGGSFGAANNALYTSSHNSWDLDVEVTADDFVSLDTSQLYLPRQADGSLPDITFGHLVSTSDLRDAGTPVDLPSVGAPDLGAFEYQG